MDSNTNTLTVNPNTSISMKKVATHSHIKGLGLNDSGRAELISSGFVGQSKAREVKENGYRVSLYF